VPILSVGTDTYTTATDIARVQPALRPSDRFKTDLAIQLFDRHVHLPTLDRHLSAVRTRGMTAKMFAYTLEARAASRPQHIVLPEGTDPRVLQAAAALLARGAVRAFTLLGKPEEIDRAIAKLGLAPELAESDRLRIVDPAKSPQFDDYVRVFHELRAHKGVTLESARDYMLDVSYFGTMMVHLGDADGMVSGAAHTTQHTIRPALQIVKTVPEVGIVSSVFFMCVASRVLVYADCAINPNPNSEQLADIAVSSAATAQAFGVEPRVALLSYSSGTSGKGEDVEKVRQATELARSRRPDLLLEGPLHNFFLGQSVVDAGGEWPFGEWDHGGDGVRAYYRALLGVDDDRVIAKTLELLAKASLKLAWDCPCGSGRRLRKCCRMRIVELRRKIRPEVARNSLRCLRRESLPTR